MIKKTRKTVMELTVPLFLIGIVMAIAVMYFVQNVMTDQTSTVSRASRSTTLTPGDDVLSLEEDLKMLESDPASAAESQLNSIQ